MPISTCNVLGVLAYLDAGSMSLLGAALAGGVAGVVMLLRMYGNKFLGLFSKKRRIKAEIAEGEGVVIAELDPLRIAQVRAQLPALAHRRL